MKILVLNGPNLNMLGIREPDIYGKRTYADLEAYIRNSAGELGVEIEIFQSNYEGELVTRIQQAYGCFDGIVINAAAYTHTSVAILDALKAVGLPAIEVHLSDINQRESFRHLSYVSMAAQKTICGLGFDGYREALRALTEAI
jgi:3-dehydroquinate dehydratase-2